MTPANTSIPPSGSGSSGSLGWVERELTRLEANKADKGYVKQIEKAIEELRRSLDKDITGLQSTTVDVKKLAEEHPCSQEERLTVMGKAIDFWSAWFVRGLIGFIMFLLTIGGLWLWSYFGLTTAVADTQRTSSSTAASIQTTVDSIQQTQEEQRRALQRIEAQEVGVKKADIDAITTAVKDALKAR